MALLQKQNYTEFDYYALPEDVHAELIDEQIYYQAAPSQVHHEILNAVNNTIYNYIKSKCCLLPQNTLIKFNSCNEK